MGYAKEALLHLVHFSALRTFSKTFAMLLSIGRRVSALPQLFDDSSVLSCQIDVSDAIFSLSGVIVYSRGFGEDQAGAASFCVF